MPFRVGDKVRISLPSGASWNRKTATTSISTEDINGREGVITQCLAFSGQAEYKVLVNGLGEFRFWERDLQPVQPIEPAEEPDA